MKYRYEVKRRRRSDEELMRLQEIWKDERDEFGDLFFDINNPEMHFDEPKVLMFCPKCGHEEDVEHMILVELNYGNKGLHALACPVCSHTKKRGALYPKVITDLEGNPITYLDVLNSQKK